MKPFSRRWLADIEEFGEMKQVLPVPGDFPKAKEQEEFAFALMSYAQQSQESMSGEGRWAQGPSIDGKGSYKYIAEPFAVGEKPQLLQKPDPTTLHSEPPK